MHRAWVWDFASAEQAQWKKWKLCLQNHFSVNEVLVLAYYPVLCVAFAEEWAQTHYST